MAEYEKLTCLKFRKKQSTDVDYLKFINDDGYGEGFTNLVFWTVIEHLHGQIHVPSSNLTGSCVKICHVSNIFAITPKHFQRINKLLSSANEFACWAWTWISDRETFCSCTFFTWAVTIDFEYFLLSRVWFM